MLGPAGKLFDGVDRERLQRQARGRRGGKITQELAERMVRPHFVVAEREDEERGRGVDTAPEVLQRVERRLVRPVDVLEDGDRRVRPDVLQESGEEAGAVCSGRRRRGGEPVEPLDDVEDRSEGSGREQRFARSPHDADLVLVASRERADE